LASYYKPTVDPAYLLGRALSLTRPTRGTRAIETLARQRRVADRVRFLGRMPQDHLPDIYSAAGLLLLPSMREGWPNVLLESMACHTPVVVSNFPGVADIVAAPGGSHPRRSHAKLSRSRGLYTPRIAARPRCHPFVRRAVRLAEHDTRADRAVSGDLRAAAQGATSRAP
jgi:glycosyltransferase involved in cell wall biosynthesis